MRASQLGAEVGTSCPIPSLHLQMVGVEWGKASRVGCLKPGLSPRYCPLALADGLCPGKELPFGWQWARPEAACLITRMVVN